MQTVVLFRYDLRKDDNPALFAAQSDHILPIFIYPEDKMGRNTAYYLSHALKILYQSLNKKLIVLDQIKDLYPLLKKYNIEKVYWNRTYHPDQIASDTQLKEKLTSLGIEAKSFNASLLYEPWTVLKDDKSHYCVYTPFYKKCLERNPRLPAKVEKLTFINHQEKDNLPKEMPLPNQCICSEKEALKKLNHFIENNLKGYKKNRDFFSMDGTSRLSYHLRFGEISPHTIWHNIKDQIGRYPDVDIECFLKELIWREFSYYQRFHFPKLDQDNWQSKFDNFPWEENSKHLKAWQLGQTGIPIVDAGMQELLTTGYMHNRVRMIVGSFLTKNLRIHWKEGEKWFWEYLLDADYAANKANWQWIAGTGFDAAPYFRVFNPILQAKKFDPDGTYIKTHLPMLKDLPLPYLFMPSEADDKTLQDCNITLGKTYPYPIVDLQNSRKLALEAFSSLK